MKSNRTNSPQVGTVAIHFVTDKTVLAHLDEFSDDPAYPETFESEARIDLDSRVAFLETPLRLSTLILTFKG